jgi:hypothetical protein
LVLLGVQQSGGLTRPIKHALITDVASNVGLVQGVDGVKQGT